MAASGNKVHKSIHWFRKGLRLHDNPALLAAYEGSTEVRAIFVLDPWFVANAHVGINRWRFLKETLQDLDDSFKKLNSRLFVVRGRPEKVFPALFKEWGVTKLTFEVDTEPYAKTRDAEVERLAKEAGVEVIKCVSHTLFDTEKTIRANKGSAPMTYQRCQTVLTSMGPPPKAIPALCKTHTEGCRTPLTGDHDSQYGVPTLEELGVNPEDLGPCLYPGGETEALERLKRSLSNLSWVCQFEKPKTEPNSLEPSTTVLSPYLKFGCLSARRFYWLLKDLYQGKKHSQPPVSLEGQLLWREFFYTVGSVTPNFDRMKGNPVCRQIPWDNNPEFLDAWKNARTGFPYIDAIMTQLKQEGWIHHLARHSVACFLTRGDLWCSWEEGMKVFEELLLDADWSLNAANWMWLSASAFFHQYFRVYSPIAFGKKTDKLGTYIKKYLPILKKFPPNYIYEPWNAPLSVQKAAGCIIGKDYPKPIVKHEVVSKENMKRMGAAYSAAKEAAGNGTSKSPAQKRPAKGGDESPAKKKKTSNNKKISDFIKKK